MAKIKIPFVFYRYLHLKIFEKAKGEPILASEVRKYLFQWKIPTRLRPLIIKELELLKLIKNKRQTLYLEKPTIDISNCNGYYEVLGFYN